MRSFIYILFVLLIFSCNKEHGEIIKLVPMNVIPSVSVNATKSLVDESNINSQQIGIHVTNSAGTAFYDAQTTYNNILLSNTGSWSTESNIYLSNSKAKIFAYSPYSSTSGDLTGVGTSEIPVARLINIPASQPMANQVDYLWAAQEKTTFDGLTDINNSNANITLKMSHTLAQVAFVIYKENYKGNGAITCIKIKDNSISPALRINKNTGNDLKMKLSDGTISGGQTSSELSVTEIVNAISLTTDPGTDPEILSDFINGYLLAVPISIADQTNMQFIFTIDGDDYSVSLEEGVLNWQQGNQYIYKVKLTADKLAITDLTVTPWTSNSNIDLPAEGGTQLPTSNCYIVAPNSSITIPVNIKGNGSSSTIEPGISNMHNAHSMGILWSTTENLISLQNFNLTDQTIKISTSSAVGNALIAAYDTDGSTILWSWHIWVTDYDPNNGGTTYSLANSVNTIYTFMDRNLGSLSTSFADDQNNLYYQFGRKDPFPGGNYSLPVLKTEPKSMIYAIQNPTIFITPFSEYNAIIPYWCSTISNDWWWGIGGSKYIPKSKTIYDPCPTGWRVPACTENRSPWDNLTNINGKWENNGWDWTTPYNVGFYPAIGYRAGSDGSIIEIGNECNIWSATAINSSNAYCLYFTETFIIQKNGKGKSYGHGVRCVRE